MKNLINGGYQGEIYPVHPAAPEIMGHRAFKSVKDIPGKVDVAVFAIPAKFVPGALIECGEKQVPGAVLIPSGFAETGEVELQQKIVDIGRQYNVRLMGPNIYGFYYTPMNLYRLRRQGPGRALVAVGRGRHVDHRLQSLDQDGRLGDHRPW
jgi:acyl-CoA synthetase (NDP forming)